MGNDISNEMSTPSQSFTWDSSTCELMASQLSLALAPNIPARSSDPSISRLQGSAAAQTPAFGSLQLEPDSVAENSREKSTDGELLVTRLASPSTVIVNSMSGHQLQALPAVVRSNLPHNLSFGIITPAMRQSDRNIQPLLQSISSSKSTDRSSVPAPAFPSPPVLRPLAPSEDGRRGNHELRVAFPHASTERNPTGSQPLPAGGGYRRDPEAPREARAPESAAASGVFANGNEAFGAQTQRAESVQLAEAAVVASGELRRSNWSVEHAVELVRWVCLPALSAAARLEFVDRLVNALGLLRSHLELEVRTD